MLPKLFTVQVYWSCVVIVPLIVPHLRRLLNILLLIFCNLILITSGADLNFGINIFVGELVDVVEIHFVLLVLA